MSLHMFSDAVSDFIAARPTFTLTVWHPSGLMDMPVTVTVTDTAHILNITANGRTRRLDAEQVEALNIRKDTLTLRLDDGRKVTIKAI